MSLLPAYQRKDYLGSAVALCVVAPEAPPLPFSNGVRSHVYQEALHLDKVVSAALWVEARRNRMAHIRHRKSTLYELYRAASLQHQAVV